MIVQCPEFLFTQIEQRLQEWQKLKQKHQEYNVSHKIFPHGHTLLTSLPAVILTDFPLTVIGDSFSVLGKEGDAVILEVAYDENIQDPKKENEIKKGKEEVKEKIRVLQKKIDVLNAQEKRQEEEKNWLATFMENRSRSQIVGEGGSVVTLDVDEAREWLKFYTGEMERIDSAIAETKAKVKELAQEKKHLQMKSGPHLSSLGPKNKSTRGITISLSSEIADQEIVLQVSYLVLRASWKSVYDVRVDSGAKTCLLVYHAQVKNNTGEDWKDVSMDLSTAEPSLKGEVRRRGGFIHPDFVLFMPATISWDYARSVENSF